MTTETVETASDGATLITPMAQRVELLLRFDEPISHHDPAVQDDSNMLQFNRQKLLITRPLIESPVAQEQVDEFCAAHPVPTVLKPALDGVSFPEFVVTALARLFGDTYNSNDGTGIFSGMARWERLESRFRMAAVRSSTLAQLWNLTCHDLGVGVPPSRADDLLMSFYSLPRPLQAAAVGVLTRTGGSRAVTTMARVWHTKNKQADPEYAKKTGREATGEGVVMAFDAATIPSLSGGVQVVDVPTVSTNTLRHQCVRAPGWKHLFARLGINDAEPGQGQLPAGVEGIFENGGNIASGAKQPNSPHALAQKIRKAFPLLDLLGGVTDSFDLGESRLKVSGWLVCAENANALRGTIAENDAANSVSVFDMLDDVTRTRQATENGGGQMIYNFETICAGAAVLVKLTLDNQASELTQGALAAALGELNANGGIIGGQSARGCGHCRIENDFYSFLPEPVRVAYEKYLSNNRDELRGWLMDGTLGSGSEVCRL